MGVLFDVGFIFNGIRVLLMKNSHYLKVDAYWTLQTTKRRLPTCWMDMSLHALM